MRHAPAAKVVCTRQRLCGSRAPLSARAARHKTQKRKSLAYAAAGAEPCRRRRRRRRQSADTYTHIHGFARVGGRVGYAGCQNVVAFRRAPTQQYVVFHIRSAQRPFYQLALPQPAAATAAVVSSLMASVQVSKHIPASVRHKQARIHCHKKFTAHANVSQCSGVSVGVDAGA